MSNVRRKGSAPEMTPAAQAAHWLDAGEHLSTAVAPGSIQAPHVQAALQRTRVVAE